MINDTFTAEKALAIEEKMAFVRSFFLNDYLKDESQDSISLLGGRGGSVIVQYMLYKYTGDETYRNKLHENIDFIINKMETAESPRFSFCDGVAGIGWLFIYLSDHQILDLDFEEFFPDLDAFLSDTINELIEAKNYDLLHGLVGVGLYFVKRGKQEEAIRVIQLLDSIAHKEKDFVCWERFDKFYKGIYVYDLGLAHGQCGIIYFLGKCFEKGILPDKCRELITGAIKFYEFVEQDVEAIGSYFTDSIAVEIFKRKHYTPIIPSKSRMAWCYGDVGILHTLLLVSGWIGERESVKKYERMLLTTTRRIEHSNNLVRDAQFCHGASGIGYVFLSAYHLTGNEVFKKAADSWIDTCLSLGNNESGTGGYLFHMGSSGFAPGVNLIGGFSGVAAFLMCHNTRDVAEGWDECFFLS